MGANSTPAVQLAPGPSEAPQVLFASWKPAGTVSARSFSGSDAPLLVTVTVIGLLVAPTPMVGNERGADAAWMAAASAPVPLSVTLAAVPMVGDMMLNVPVFAPVDAGAKTTSTVQLAPAGRLLVQVFCARANPIEADNTNWLAAKLLLLLTVTVCGALDDPATVGRKINCGGLAFRPKGTWPLPLRATVAGVFTSAPAMSKLAELVPVVPGLKVTCTVQLLPGASTVVQVLAAMAK